MAGVVQLVALGAQDKFLTENPTVSFFRQKYNKHTNFSMTQKRMVIQGTQAIGQSSIIRVDHTGDLLAGIRLVSTDEHKNTVARDAAAWQTIIESVELLIGDQVIDKHTSEFDKELAPDLFAKNLAESEVGGQISEFYPLRFSCFEHFSSALPIIALQYHDVRIRINWATTGTFAPSTDTVEAYASWIHLDTIERTFFAENELHYIITQVQKATASGGKEQDLMFNNPVKFIASNNGGGGSFWDRANKMKMQINGVDLEDYTWVVPNFTAMTSAYHAPFSDANATAYMLYPFCLNTSSHQPSGSLNFSRLDSARLFSETENIVHDIYGVNYNVLKVSNGMGGLLFSD